MPTLRRIPQDPDCGIYTFVSSPSSQTTQHYPSKVKKKEMSRPKGEKHIHNETALKHKYRRRECCLLIKLQKLYLNRYLLTLETLFNLFLFGST